MADEINSVTSSNPIRNEQTQERDREVSDRLTSDFDRTRQDGAPNIPASLQNPQSNTLMNTLSGRDAGDGFQTLGSAQVQLASWQGNYQRTPISPENRFDEELARRHPSFERALNQALTEVGDLGPNARPVYGRLNDSAGQLVGFQSADGSKGFRIDFSTPDPSRPDRPSGPHVNWWDRTEGTKRGQGQRTGAEYWPGTQEEYQRRLQDYQRFDPATRQLTEQQRQQQQQQQQQTPQEQQSFRRRMELLTGLTGAALTAYLIISEGSRLFPPRNLIPIP